MTEVQLPDKQHYYEQVWAQVRMIPSGIVATYGQIAKLLPAPEGISDTEYQAYGPRWAGLAMAACPEEVPWHRVVNSQGRLSHPTEAAMQKEILQAEGVLFFNEKIDLREFQWRGPEQSEHFIQGRLF